MLDDTGMPQPQIGATGVAQAVTGHPQVAATGGESQQGFAIGLGFGEAGGVGDSLGRTSILA